MSKSESESESARNNAAAASSSDSDSEPDPKKVKIDKKSKSKSPVPLKSVNTNAADTVQIQPIHVSSVAAPPDPIVDENLPDLAKDPEPAVDINPSEAQEKPQDAPSIAFDSIDNADIKVSSPPEPDSALAAEKQPDEKTDSSKPTPAESKPDHSPAKEKRPYGVQADTRPPPIKSDDSRYRDRRNVDKKSAGASDKYDRRKRDETRRRRSRSRSRTRSRSRQRRRSKEPMDKKTEATTTDSTSTTAKAVDPEIIPRRQQRTVDLLTSKTGGAYIPPAKLRLLQAEITDKSSAAYQRIAWEALKKSIHGYINKVNVDNIGIITRELLKENIVRGKGLLCRSIIQAQAASPTFTHVYAALVAVINSKFPNIGDLLLKRLVIQFKRGFRRNDKTICLSSSRFVAHLVNQRVAHEILALETLTLLVETPTDDSVEVAIAFLKECGMKLQEVSSKGVNAIFEMLKNILHEGKLDKRVQYMIEVVFQVRKDGFKDHIAILESLELVEEDDQFTHMVMLDDATDPQDVLSECCSLELIFIFAVLRCVRYLGLPILFVVDHYHFRTVQR